MNRTYALVWNTRLGTWSVASEHARRRGKGSGAVVATATALLLGGPALATDLPTGGQVIAGQGQIGSPTNQQLIIDQASNKLAIDWQSFDIAAGNTVTFKQPGSDAIALNRVLGADGSKIMGQLDANGQVFIINPNGVLFGQSAQVNVGGLVASTLEISNSDFEAGHYTFKGDGSNASVINQGQITAADGGSIALLGGMVSNRGVIVANQGTVALAAGNAVTLDFAGDGLLNVQVDAALVDALVENHQLIKADGGQVLLSANAGEALLKTVVNNTGVIEAHTLGEKNGKIVLMGSFEGGTVQVAGTLDASAANGGNGGFIDTSGAHLQVADNTKVTTRAANGKTGTWLIDPTDFTVSAGNAPNTASGIGASTLGNNLNNTGVVLQTADTGDESGDIHVNAAVTWSADTTLTLNAHNDIHINAAITATGANAGLVLNHGGRVQNGTVANGSDYHVKAPITLSGSNASLTINGNAYTLLHSMADLQTVGTGRLHRYYALAQDLDASGTLYAGALIGINGGNPFSTTFTGLGHTISNLTINAPNTERVGLFGTTDTNSVVRDIGLLGGSVSGTNLVGGLVGMSYGTISNAYATANVTGKDIVGGLVGNSIGTIDNAYTAGNVTGTGNFVGGLVGNSGGTIDNAYTTGSVTGTGNYVGGLVGWNASAIHNAYATGNVEGNDYVGGLVGFNNDTISNTYATGNVEGNSYVGGLVGFHQSGITTSINDSFYATTDASGNAINNGGASSGPFRGNLNGTAKTWAELSDPDTFSAWDQSIWSFPQADASIAGYGVGLPFLTGITRTADIARGTLFSGGFGTQANAYTITSWQQLANINRVPGGGYHFSLSNSLDKNSLGYAILASATAHGGSGWNPLGNSNTAFIGTLDGQNHIIGDIVINRSNTDHVGMFGYTGANSVIRNIGLVNGTVTGNHNVGGLVGNNAGTISNAYATANVTGNINAGGLTGNSSGNIDNAYATSNVSGNNAVGGLAGLNDGTISNTYATGNVTGNSNIGGLVGFNNDNSSINDSFYATTDASGNAINNGGASSDAFTGNTHGTAQTWDALSNPAIYAGWDTSIWSLPGTNTSVAGYSVALPYLTAVTRPVDIVLRPIRNDSNNDVRNTPPYIGAMASNGQTMSTHTTLLSQASEALTQVTLLTNPLDDQLNLQIINHGIRLPEGI